MRWSVPLRVDGRDTAIRGAVERVPRPPLAWAIGAGLALAAGAGLVLLFGPHRRATYVLVGGLAVVAMALPYGESEATGNRHWGILVAAVVQQFSKWSAPLYLSGGLFLLGALCWLWVDPTKPVSE